MRAISRRPRRRASAALVLLAGCAPKAPEAGPVPETTLPLSRVFVLEAAGAMPDDTTVTVVPGIDRVIVLRRSAPDFGLFARVTLPDTALRAGGNGSPAELTLRPVPGEYGLDLEITDSLAPGGTLLFSYGSHFVAPAGARERYGSDLLFERELRIARVRGAGDSVELLPTSRPGTDLVGAVMPAAGRYLVVAPR
ncbi:MAG: hypothetical protein ACT4PM_09760 [Gemmatimonadales bacterium]